MKAKYKMTGCARFLIFLVILGPIAYFGSQYLRDSGTWDKIRDKIEDRDRNSVERTIDEKRIPIELPSDNSDLADQFERLRQAYEEQELVLAKQDQTIKNLQEENESLRKRLNDPLIGSIPPSNTSTEPSDTRSQDNTGSPNTSGTSGSPSLDDLLKEADSNLGTNTGNSGGDAVGTRTTLGEWNFNFSGSTGIIEFYRQDNRLFSRVSIEGDNRINIDELTRSGDRFSVNNSQEGEYYVLLSNGNLEAHDSNGFQTTCNKR